MAHVNVHQRESLAEYGFEVDVSKGYDYMAFNIKFSDSHFTFFIKATEHCSVEEEFDMFAEKISRALYESKYL